MRTLWVHRDIDASAEAVWAQLTNLESWPTWGPTVRHAELGTDHFERGATGVVTTVFGLDLPFEITDFDAGRCWAWKVAGVRATSHTVKPLGSARCQVGFGVPWPAAPYLAVCGVALRRIDTIVTGGMANE